LQNKTQLTQRILQISLPGHGSYYLRCHWVNNNSYWGQSGGQWIQKICRATLSSSCNWTTSRWVLSTKAHRVCPQKMAIPDNGITKLSIKHQYTVVIVSHLYQGWMLVSDWPVDKLATALWKTPEMVYFSELMLRKVSTMRLEKI